MPQVQKQNLENLKLLRDGIAIYHAQKVFPGLNGQEIWRSGSTKLYEYSNIGRPILFVPSLINKPHILDLSQKHSLLLRLANLGMRPYLLDWGTPDTEEEHFNLDNYAYRLLSALEFLNNRSGKIVISGYCMGGQLAIAAGCLAPDMINRIILIATPWDFSSFKKNINLFRTLPNPVPASFFQLYFYHLEPLSVNRKFINLALGRLDKQEFSIIENWANSGVPIVKNVVEQFLQDFITNNDTLNKKWCVGGKFIIPKAVPHQVLCVVAKNDRVAPEISCKPLHHALGNSSLLRINSGHVGMVINARYKLAEAILSFS